MEQHQPEHEDVMEVPEMDSELLDELLNSTEGEAEQAGGRDNFVADDVGDSWVGSQEQNSAIHPHQSNCEDCGLDDILCDLEGCGCSPAPYVLDPVEYWTEEMEAPNAECVGEWYMDGMVMEWDDGRSYYSFYPSHGGDASTDQMYSSPLWE